MRFIVLGTPITQGSMKSIGRGRMIHQNSKKLNEWRDAVAKEFEKNRPDKWDPSREFELMCTFHMKRPKKPVHEYPVKDLDKLIRSLNDALTNHAWDDDKQVTSIIATKIYDEPEGVEIVINVIEGDTRCSYTN